MRALNPERRVVAVARVEPRVVGKAREELGLDVVDELLERRRVAEGVADAAGEERVAG